VISVFCTLLQGLFVKKLPLWCEGLCVMPAIALVLKHSAYLSAGPPGEAVCRPQGGIIAEHGVTPTLPQAAKSAESYGSAGGRAPKKQSSMGGGHILGAHVAEAVEGAGFIPAFEAGDAYVVYDIEGYVAGIVEGGSGEEDVFNLADDEARAVEGDGHFLYELHAEANATFGHERGRKALDPPGREAAGVELGDLALEAGRGVVRLAGEGAMYVIDGVVAGVDDVIIGMAVFGEGPLDEAQEGGVGAQMHH